MIGKPDNKERVFQPLFRKLFQHHIKTPITKLSQGCWARVCDSPQKWMFEEEAPDVEGIFSHTFRSLPLNCVCVCQQAYRLRSWMLWLLQQSLLWLLLLFGEFSIDKMDAQQATDFYYRCEWKITDVHKTWFYCRNVLRIMNLMLASLLFCSDIYCQKLFHVCGFVFLFCFSLIFVSFISLQYGSIAVTRIPAKLKCIYRNACCVARSVLFSLLNFPQKQPNSTYTCIESKVAPSQLALLPCLSALFFLLSRAATLYFQPNAPLQLRQVWIMRIYRVFPYRLYTVYTAQNW